MHIRKARKERQIQLLLYFQSVTFIASLNCFFHILLNNGMWNLISILNYTSCILKPFQWYSDYRNHLLFTIFTISKTLHQVKELPLISVATVFVDNTLLMRHV